MSSKLLFDDISISHITEANCKIAVRPVVEKVYNDIVTNDRQNCLPIRIDCVQLD